MTAEEYLVERRRFVTELGLVPIHGERRREVADRNDIDHISLWSFPQNLTWRDNCVVTMTVYTNGGYTVALDAPYDNLEDKLWAIRAMTEAVLK